MKQKRELYCDGTTLYQRCCKCLQMLPDVCFSLDGTKLHTVCKECKKEYDKEYRSRTKEQRAEKARMYREKNHEELIVKGREKYKENPKKYINASNEYRRNRVKENGFAWEGFHEQARKYVRENGIKFDVCFGCNTCKTIELHHPSYESRDMRSIVVPLCKSCHRRVHAGTLDCPAPIKLTELVTCGRCLADELNTK